MDLAIDPNLLDEKYNFDLTNLSPRGKESNDLLPMAGRESQSMWKTDVMTEETQLVNVSEI